MENRKKKKKKKNGSSEVKDLTKHMKTIKIQEFCGSLAAVNTSKASWVYPIVRGVCNVLRSNGPVA